MPCGGISRAALAWSDRSERVLIAIHIGCPVVAVLLATRPGVWVAVYGSLHFLVIGRLRPACGNAVHSSPLT
jgi:hypothetical protein